MTDQWKFNPAKYEGHTEKWNLEEQDGLGDAKSRWIEGESMDYLAVVCKRKDPKEDAANLSLVLDAPHLLAEVVRLREVLRAARRAMNDEWVKYYERDRPAPALLKEAVNCAIRVLGEEG